jgi:hypothetical protein
VLHFPLAIFSQAHHSSLSFPAVTSNNCSLLAVCGGAVL